MSLGKPLKVMMTVEEFLALPDDGVHLELIRGEVRVIRREPWDDPNAPIVPTESKPRRSPSYRNRFFGRALSRITSHLATWHQRQPEPRGEVLCGEAAFQFRGPVESFVGIDAAFVSADAVTATPPEQAFHDIPPVLAVEICSPSDTQEDMTDRIELYLENGAVVWIVDPELRAVTVYRRGQQPIPLREDEDLIGDPELPDFRVPVSRLFAD